MKAGKETFSFLSVPLRGIEEEDVRKGPFFRFMSGRSSTPIRSRMEVTLPLIQWKSGRAAFRLGRATLFVLSLPKQ